jgi:uncharacterized protein YeaO (DUF488 family)
MLLRAPVAALKAGQISKRHAHVVVAMRHYPRFTPKELVHEYVRALAPEATLFSEFKALDRSLKEHNLAFAAVRYEERFQLAPEGVAQLQRLAAQAATKDVYLICQCDHEQRCHCDLLLLLAQAREGAAVAQLPFEYPIFAARIAAGEV